MADVKIEYFPFNIYYGDDTYKALLFIGESKRGGLLARQVRTDKQSGNMSTIASNYLVFGSERKVMIIVS